MKTTKKHKVEINEVDCYISNSKTTKYATRADVQHQMLVNNEPMGRLNGVADADRGERVVLKKEVGDKFFQLFEKGKKLKSKMKSEYCSSEEEYIQAAEFNKPIKTQLKSVVKQMWDIESLGLEFEVFYDILRY